MATDDLLVYDDLGGLISGKRSRKYDRHERWSRQPHLQNGTTFIGGNTTNKNCMSNGGCGTIFKVSTSGKEAVLHRFNGTTDDAEPFGNLIYLNGALYGTDGSTTASESGVIFKQFLH